MPASTEMHACTKGQTNMYTSMKPVYTFKSIKNMLYSNNHQVNMKNYDAVIILFTCFVTNSKRSYKLSSSKEDTIQIYVQLEDVFYYKHLFQNLVLFFVSWNEYFEGIKTTTIYTLV